MHTGLPWVRDAYNKLCDVVCKDNKFDNSITAIIKDDIWDDIVSQCSSRLTDYQKKKLVDAKEQITINSRSKGMRR